MFVFVLGATFADVQSCLLALSSGITVAYAQAQGCAKQELYFCFVSPVSCVILFAECMLSVQHVCQMIFFKSSIELNLKDISESSVCFPSEITKEKKQSEKRGWTILPEKKRRIIEGKIGLEDTR